MPLILTILLLITSSLTWAGDAAQLNFIGFSKTGKNLAFQEYGTEDGSNVTYATTYFIDVEKNKYAAKPVTTRNENDKNKLSEHSVQQINLGQATDLLTQLGIVTHNRGQKLASRLITDLGVNPKEVQFVLTPPLGGTLPSRYTLKLTEESAEADCFGMGEPKIFTLSLFKGEQESILQKDTQIPQSRGCPLSYRIQDVYWYQDKYIAVFINILTLGFEGQNLRYQVVTGKL